MRANVLLLQGPVGPFFKRFASELETRGFAVWKINFNGGDRLFFGGPQAVDYTGSVDAWKQYLHNFLVNRAISRLYLFGDCRVYHRIASELAAEIGVEVFVFEEGYIRPNFITLERGGVNGNSSMMNQPLELDQLDVPIAAAELSAPRLVFHTTVLYSTAYYTAMAHSRQEFRGYRHHRPVGCLSEGIHWIRSGIRKGLYRSRDRRLIKNIMARFEGNYFLCPLQVHCDMQVVVHSEFNSIEHFLGEVLLSFAGHAPPNKAIVFKHHPLDRGYTNYRYVLDNLSAELGIQDRVFYVHDAALPGLLQSAEGTVLINSTVGLSSIFHGTPVKTLGRAVYDMPGLTSALDLDQFWVSPGKVDRQRFARLRQWLMEKNQLNGNFYRRIDRTTSSGVCWSSSQLHEHSHAIEDRRADQPALVEPLVAPVIREPLLPALDRPSVESARVVPKLTVVNGLRRSNGREDNRHAA